MNKCSSCINRSGCDQLCSACEKYVNADYVPMREVPWRYIAPYFSIEKAAINSPWDESSNFELGHEEWIEVVFNCDFTKKQKKYGYLHYWEDMSYEEIAVKYSVSKQTVFKSVQLFKKKLWGVIKI